MIDLFQFITFFNLGIILGLAFRDIFNEFEGSEIFDGLTIRETYDGDVLE